VTRNWNDNSETHSRVIDAFKDMYGELVDIRMPGADCSDNRDPAKICWMAKNIWLHPNLPKSHDVQMAAWHGEAWSSQNGRMSGIWFGMGIEFKNVFDIVLGMVSPGSFASEASILDGFRISLGSAGRSSAQYNPILVGRNTSEAEYNLIFDNIRRIQASPGLPRPHLQVYTKIGRWVDDTNTVPILTQKMKEAEEKMGGLLRLVTGGAYPKGDVQ